jgi:hypothetical protein
MAHFPTSKSEFSISSKVPKTLNLPTSRSTASLLELLSAPDAPSAEGVFMMEPRLPERDESRSVASYVPNAGTRSQSLAPPPLATLPSFPSDVSLPGMVSASTSLESNLSLMTIATPNMMIQSAPLPSVIYMKQRIYTSVPPQQVDPLSFARSVPESHPSHYHPYDRAKIPRAKTACISCRGTKTKCSARKVGEQPCDPCVQHGKVCIWPEKKEKKRGTTKSSKDKSETPSVDQVSQSSAEPTPARSLMSVPASDHVDASLPGKSFLTSSVFEQPQQPPTNSTCDFQPSYSIRRDQYMDLMGRYGASGLDLPPIRGVTGGNGMRLLPLVELERTRGQGSSDPYTYMQVDCQSAQK